MLSAFDILKPQVLDEYGTPIDPTVEYDLSLTLYANASGHMLACPSFRLIDFALPFILRDLAIVLFRKFQPCIIN